MYTNKPLNQPEKRRDPAVKALAVISVTLAMMFAVKLIYDPRAEGVSELAVEAGALPAAGEAAPVSAPVGDDPVAACVASGGIAPPHDGAVSSGYADRADPFDPTSVEFHRGIDLAGEGEVRAWSAGTVEAAGESESYGRYIRIRHSPRVVSLYAHLAETSAVPGDHVAAGDVIGRAGETGRATAVHLHFEIQVDGSPVDPQNYVP